MRIFVWFLAVAALTSGIFVAGKAVLTTNSAVQIGSDIASGKRPYAPQLPKDGLKGISQSPLPAWAAKGARNWSAGGGNSKIAVVNFWASWCGPCKEEAKIFSDLAREYKSEGVVFVGVNGEDVASDAKAFVKRYKMKYAVVRMQIGEKARWGVQGFPETFIVGSDGRISVHYSGPIEEETLRSAIDSELVR